MKNMQKQTLSYTPAGTESGFAASQPHITRARIMGQNEHTDSGP